MNRFIPLSGKLIPRGRVPPRVAYKSEISAIGFECYTSLIYDINTAKNHTMNEDAYPIVIKLPIGEAEKVLNYHAGEGRSKTHSESSAKPLHIHSGFVLQSRPHRLLGLLTEYNVEE